MFALAAAVMFLIAAIKSHDEVPQFWLYLGLMLWSLQYALDPFLRPYYPVRRTRTTTAP